MPEFAKFLSAVGAALILSPGVFSSEPPISLLYQIDGAAARDNLGISVALTGDLDGDGRSDFIIGAWQADPGGLTNAGSAYVYSGSTGALLYQKDGTAANDLMGFPVASAGDVNGDGNSDFIVGAYGVGSAFIYSGADGSLLYQKSGGISMASAGDVNGDGNSDFIIGTVYAIGAGSAFVYSGADGSVLFQKNGTGSDWFGYSVASGGDVNKDGKTDFIIGAPDATPNGLTNAGTAYLYSGADGSLLYQKNGEAGYDLLGWSVASTGDVNEDESPDFIIGAKYANPGGLDNAGSAYLYSGADGSLLYQKNGDADFDNLGFSVASAGDMNGDGKPDFIIGALNASPNGLSQAGSVYIYSGADGSLLYQINGAAPYDQLGISLAGADDVNGDGKADIIIGTFAADPSGLPSAGSAYVYGLHCTSTAGDMNADGRATPADVVLMLNCVFLESRGCYLCFSDLNCDGVLNTTDVMLELRWIFLGEPVTCTP